MAVMKSDMFVLRPVTSDDVDLLFRWANDPLVRANSFNSEVISWNTHTTWFEHVLHSDGVRIYIAIGDNDAPIGQIRYTLTDADAVVGLSLDVKVRGRGIASRLICDGTSKYLQDCVLCERVHAYVKVRNFPSAQAFLKAGYVEATDNSDRAECRRHFIFARQGKI